MSDDEYEIHPLDRDYSAPVQPPFATKVDVDTKVRRIGIGIFGSGFVVLLLVAIVLGSFRGSGTIESVGSTAHRLGMVLILIGGGMIILAYRLPALRKTFAQSTHGAALPRTSSSYGTLVLANVVAFVLIAGASYLLSFTAPAQISFLLFNVILTLTTALLVTVAIWQQGYIRAYAIGVLVALMLNSFSLSSLVGLNGSLWGQGARLFMLSNVALVLITGLVCALYVLRLESRAASGADTSDSGRD